MRPARKDSSHAARSADTRPDSVMTIWYDPAKAWSDRIDSGPPLIRTACPQPRPMLPPGADLNRNQWVKLNRLRCGTDTLKLWGVQESVTGLRTHHTACGRGLHDTQGP